MLLLEFVDDVGQRATGSGIRELVDGCGVMHRLLRLCVGREPGNFVEGVFERIDITTIHRAVQLFNIR